MALENLTKEQMSALSTEELTNYVVDIHSDVSEKGLLPEKYCTIWSQLRIALIIAKMFTPSKVDKIIDEIIKAGDATCGTGDNN